MEDPFVRARILFGSDGLDRLQNARVAIFGLGGVGGFAFEALVRSGVGALDLIDNDTVSLSNLNRQLLALRSTVGMRKTDVAAARAADINPSAVIRTYPVFVTAENIDIFPFAEYDYVIDAIDTVSAKIALVLRCRDAGVPILCSMGTGNKLDPSALRIADLSETRYCHLARVMRKELRRRGVEHLKVIYSEEIPAIREEGSETKGVQGRPAPGSTAFVPPTAGLMIACEVVRYLAGV